MPETQPQVLSIADTSLDTWFERDRAYVGLQDATGHVLVEWWDGDVWEAIHDGFLSDRGFILGRLVNKRPLHESAFECYQQSIQE